MGIRTHGKSKAQSTLKLADHISSFMFEQEWGELKFFTQKQKDSLKKTMQMLYKVASQK